MLNYIWGIMLLLGITVGVLTGQTKQVDTALIDSTKDAISLCITMLGVMALWTGLMEIAKETGLIAQLTRKLKKPLHFLFPDVPVEHPAMEYIASNIIANILGLGWAATPMGLKAMKELAKLQTAKTNHSSTHLSHALSTETKKSEGSICNAASADMCTFLILNISSLQLIPVSILAYRSQYGSANPSAITGMSILATSISTLAGIVFSVLARRFWSNPKKLR